MARWPVITVGEVVDTRSAGGALTRDLTLQRCLVTTAHAQSSVNTAERMQAKQISNQGAAQFGW